MTYICFVIGCGGRRCAPHPAYDEPLADLGALPITLSQEVTPPPLHSKMLRLPLRPPTHFEYNSKSTPTAAAAVLNIVGQRRGHVRVVLAVHNAHKHREHEQS